MNKSTAELQREAAKRFANRKFVIAGVRENQIIHLKTELCRSGCTVEWDSIHDLLYVMDGATDNFPPHNGNKGA